MTAPPRRLLTLAVRDLFATATGRPIGILKAPAPLPGATAPALPYGILYPIDGTTYPNPSFADAYTDASIPYQVSSFGAAYEQVEGMADLLRQAALNAVSHPLLVDGYVVMARDIDSAASTPESVGAELFSVVERFRFTITPQ